MSDLKGKELAKVYKQDKSIECYVKLRRENPESEIEVALNGGIDVMFFMEKELEKYGFDPWLVVSVMDADEAAVNELSLQILEKIIEARQLQKSGETHLSSREKIVPDKLISWLIAVMLDAMSWNNKLNLSRDLLVLVREQIGGSNLDYQRSALISEKRRNAVSFAAQSLAQRVKPSYRSLAGLFDVSPSTVKRWFAEGEFDREVQHQSKLYDAKGNFIWPFSTSEPTAKPEGNE